MEGTEKVVEHLKMTQAVINRLANNCVLVKGWSMTIILAAMVFISRLEKQNPYFVLGLALPIFLTWILDAYFLRQERLFRKIYDEIRIQGNTDFEMNPQKHKNKPKCGTWAAFRSITLAIFYGVELIFIVIVFFIFMIYGETGKYIDIW